MEARLLAIENNLKGEAERRERATKYTHNMIEDLQVKIVSQGLKLGIVESTLNHHVIEDAIAQQRLATIERLVWIAVGGIAVIAALVGIVGGNILKLLSH